MFKTKEIRSVIGLANGCGQRYDVSKAMAEVRSIETWAQPAIEIIPEPAGRGFQARFKNQTEIWERGDTEAEAALAMMQRLASLGYMTLELPKKT